MVRLGLQLNVNRKASVSKRGLLIRHVIHKPLGGGDRKSSV